MKTEHTPGPWHSKERMVYTDRLEIALVREPFRMTQTQSEANARLIAAAPELLEACKLLLSEWRSRTAMIESCDLTPGEDKAEELAEAAISKATQQ